MPVNSGLALETYQTRTDLYFLLRGRIVLEECERLRNSTLPLINKGIEQVVVDMNQVDFVDSAGLGTLVGIKMTASKNKARIMLLQPSKPVADILYISKLDGIFDIVTGQEAELLKSQIVQPQHLVGGPGASQGTQQSEEATSGQRISTTGQGSSSGGLRVDTNFPDITLAGAESNSPGPELRSQKEIIDEHCRRAVAYMRQNNYDMSVEEYRKALEVDPDYLPALNNLAIVYEKQPSWIGKAIEQWEHVLQLSQSRGDQKHIDRAQRHLASLRKMSV
jgi:anti-anti-sigma factor